MQILLSANYEILYAINHLVLFSLLYIIYTKKIPSYYTHLCKYDAITYEEHTPPRSHIYNITAILYDFILPHNIYCTTKVVEISIDLQNKTNKKHKRVIQQPKICRHNFLSFSFCFEHNTRLP